MGFNAFAAAVRPIGYAALAVVLQVANGGAHADDSLAEASADRLGGLILDQVPAYTASKRDRALAACIDWDGPAEQPVQVHNIFWFYTSPGSDVPVFHSKLMNRAIAECDRNKPADISCRCVRVAMDDDIVLDVPDTVLARLSEDAGDQATASGEPIGTLPPDAIQYSLTKPVAGAEIVEPASVSLTTEGLYVVVQWESPLKAGGSYLLQYRLVDTSRGGVLRSRYSRQARRCAFPNVAVVPDPRPASSGGALAR